MQHKARKRFGQNFLTSDHIIWNIINTIQPKENDFLLEIGPGLGALTEPLLHHAPSMHVIEIDRDLIRLLHKKFPELNIHHGDALTFDYEQWGKHIRLVGNLPYNISTPLLFHLAQFCDYIQDMHFMLQKEVVDRMTASPNTHDYGRLSIMLQYRFQITQIFDVPPEAFNPPPKVMSSIVRLIPYKNLPWESTDEKFFHQIVTQAFAHRRKTLKNNLSTLISDPSWWNDISGINPNQRAESLSISDFIYLTNELRKKIP